MRLKVSKCSHKPIIPPVSTTAMMCLPVPHNLFVLLILPILQATAGAIDIPVFPSPKMSCSCNPLNIPCIQPPCPSACFPGQICKTVPCVTPPCPEYCATPRNTRPGSDGACQCMKCHRWEKCEEDYLTGHPRCVRKFPWLKTDASKNIVKDM